MIDVKRKGERKRVLVTGYPLMTPSWKPVMATRTQVEKRAERMARERSRSDNFQWTGVVSEADDCYHINFGAQRFPDGR